MGPSKQKCHNTYPWRLKKKYSSVFFDALAYLRSFNQKCWMLSSVHKRIFIVIIRSTYKMRKYLKYRMRMNSPVSYIFSWISLGLPWGRVGERGGGAGRERVILTLNLIGTVRALRHVDTLRKLWNPIWYNIILFIGGRPEACKGTLWSDILYFKPF